MPNTRRRMPPQCILISGLMVQTIHKDACPSRETSNDVYFSFSRSPGKLFSAASGASENMSSIWATTAV